MDNIVKQNISERSTFFNSEFGKVNCFSFGEDRGNVLLALEYLLSDKLKKPFSSVSLINKKDKQMLSFAFENPEDLLLLADALRQIYKKITNAYNEENKSEIL